MHHGSLRVAVFHRAATIGAALCFMLADEMGCEIVAHHDTLGSHHIADLADARVNVVLVDHEVLPQNAAHIPGLARLAPVLELVDLACRACPQRRGKSARVSEGDTASPSSSSCRLVPVNFAASCWNVVSIRSEPGLLRSALSRTAARLPFADPAALAQCDPLRHPPHHLGALDTLSAREREVVELICLGRSDKEVAHELGLAVKTVGKHVSAVLLKLGCRSRVDFAVRYGVLLDTPNKNR